MSLSNRMANADLNGGVNDVTNIRDSRLEYFGFQVEEVRLPVDDDLPVQRLFRGMNPSGSKYKAENPLPDYLVLFAGCRFL